MSVTRKDANQLKKGNYLLVDGAVCRITSEPIHSKSGKHGHAKMRFDAENLYSGKKSSVVMPGGESVDVPNIEKRTGQVISKSPDSVTVMDAENFQNFEVELPTEEDMKGKIAADQTVEYWIVMDKKIIVRIM